MIALDIQRIAFKGELLLKRMKRAEKKAFMRAGALVRTTARRSIRKAKKRVSRPGEPPKSHQTHEPNLRTIRFEYVPRESMVIVGPIKFNSRGTGTNATVPQVLESGGMTTLRKYERGRSVETRIRIAPRPFMGPAHKKVSETVAKLFEGAI